MIKNSKNSVTCMRHFPKIIFKIPPSESSFQVLKRQDTLQKENICRWVITDAS